MNRSYLKILAASAITILLISVMLLLQDLKFINKDITDVFELGLSGNLQFRYI